MSKHPNVPCSICGTMLRSGPKSLPASSRKCQPCRRERPKIRRARSPFPSLTCEACEGIYIPSRRTQRWCSLACYNRHHPPSTKDMTQPRYTAEEARERIRQSWQQKNRRRRAAKRGRPSEPYTLAEIAARDGLRCGLCGKTVPMAVKVPEPLAPTIDHIVPIFIGGDDTRANVQLAHFRCNSVKGPRGSQQLALIG